MVFEATVENGIVRLPADVDVPNGTAVRIETLAPKRFRDLLDLAGTWAGDDADSIVEEMYARRSSAPGRASISNSRSPV